MDRRDFLKLMGGVAGSNLLPSYAKAKETTRILQNEDKPGFYVRFYKPFKAVDASKWSLDVSGLCESPRRFTLQELKQIPKVTQISRLKCVECWSVKAKWGGFAPRSLFEIVKPKDNGIFLYFESAENPQSLQ